MVQRARDVICIGKVCQDILLTGIPVDALTSAEGSFTAGTWQVTFGGDGANQAAVLAHLGENAAFAGRIGTDAVGQSLAAAMKKEGVDLSLASMSDTYQNTLSVVLVTQDGNHTFLVGRGRDNSPAMKEINPDLFETARAVSFSSVFSLGSLDYDGRLESLAASAREKGAITFADLKHDTSGIGPKGHDKLYEHIDYLAPSYEEALYVTGEREPERMARHFLDLGAHHVMIKLGSEGSYYSSGQTSFYTDPYEIEAVDTTGCGDNFMAGLIHAVLRKAGEQAPAQGKTANVTQTQDAMHAVLEYAGAAGALNALGAGAHACVSSAQAVEAFRKTHVQRKCARKAGPE